MLSSLVCLLGRYDQCVCVCSMWRCLSVAWDQAGCGLIPRLGVVSFPGWAWSHSQAGFRIPSFSQQAVYTRKASGLVLYRTDPAKARSEHRCESLAINRTKSSFCPNSFQRICLDTFLNTRQLFHSHTHTHHHSVKLEELKTEHSKLRQELQKLPST